MSHLRRGYAGCPRWGFWRWLDHERRHGGWSRLVPFAPFRHTVEWRCPYCHEELDRTGKYDPLPLADDYIFPPHPGAGNAPVPSHSHSPASPLLPALRREGLQKRLQANTRSSVTVPIQDMAHSIA